LSPRAAAELLRARIDDAQHVTSALSLYIRRIHLGKLLGRYLQTDDPVPYALADYNAGRANVLRWLTGSATTNSATQPNANGTQRFMRDPPRRSRADIE